MNAPDDRSAGGRGGPDRPHQDTSPAPAAAGRLRAVGKLLVLVAGLVAGGLLLRSLGATPGTEWVDRHVRGQG
ncbi:MAG: hypothetical protein IRY87_28050, partial [Acetobacteraceae bacterium]|nr:hypothetical protein [Acetobacteraceae bacterium]